MAVINNTINDSILVTSFSSNNTWTMNARTQFVKVYCWSGGSGGGSGYQGLSTAAGGGAGGCAGGVQTCSGPALFFPSSCTVTIGAGGNGGAGQSTAATTGNPGSNGGDSAFGNMGATGTSSSPGAGGINGSSVGGSGATTYYSFCDNGLNGNITSAYSGGAGHVTGGTKGSAMLIDNTNTVCSLFGASGAGGGGADSGTPRVGGTGGDIECESVSLLAGGTPGFESTVINGGNGQSSLTAGLGIMTGGTGGGGGGGQSSGSVAGNGGTGGLPGGGGGGGGGSLTLTTSGAGGTGGAGYVIVVEYF